MLFTEENAAYLSTHFHFPHEKLTSDARDAVLFSSEIEENIRILL